MASSWATYPDNGSLTNLPMDVTEPGGYSRVIRNSQGDKQIPSTCLNLQRECNVCLLQSGGMNFVLKELYRVFERLILHSSIKHDRL